MTDLEIEILFDSIADALRQRGKSPDQIEEYLTFESERVAQEARDAEESNT